jgi:hypothetical protein
MEVYQIIGFISMRNKDVVEGFLRGERCNTLHLFSTGKRLFSYNTCIAEKTNGVIWVNRTKYSVTTSIHLGLLLRRILGKTTIREVRNISINSGYLKSHE